jgi:hypothetical protein
VNICGADNKQVRIRTNQYRKRQVSRTENQPHDSAVSSMQLHHQVQTLSKRWASIAHPRTFT